MPYRLDSAVAHVCLWLMMGSTLLATDAVRPNILWIVAEDMSPTLGCYGDEYATTPNIDRLAEQSYRYTNAFATAPVCSPSRSCLITGSYATTLGTQQMRSAFPIPDRIHGFPSILRQAGYYTSNNYKTDYNTSTADRIIAESWDESSTTAHWRKRPPVEAGEQPFFSVFNLMTSHQSRSMVFTQARFREEVQSKLSQGDIHDADSAPLPPYYPDTLVTRRIVSRYYDCVTVMDQQVGEILRQLDEDGLAENTIVFFYSDHGSGMPRHKRLLHDSGMRVPLLVRIPEKYAHLRPGAETTIDQPVSFVDFPPTLLSMIGLAPPPEMQGKPFLGGRSAHARPREYIYGHRDRIDEVVDLSRSVRDRRYLYIRSFMPHLSWNQYSSYSDLSEIRHEIYREAAFDSMTGPQRHYAGPTKWREELYDCVADPMNTTNLIDDDVHAETLERLRGALTAHLRTSRDLGFIPEIRAWELFSTSTPWQVANEGDLEELTLAQQAAEAVISGDAELAVDHLRSTVPSVRYWGAIGLASVEEITDAQMDLLRASLKDPSVAVRIAAASGVATHGASSDAVETLVPLLDSAELSTVLHACRAIELMGEAARKAVPAMKRVASRVEKLTAADTPAIFSQSGERDLAMFCGFSANGFLTRLRQSDWQHLISDHDLEGWDGADTDAVKLADGHQLTMLSRGKNLWIVHQDEFRDFELTAEVRMPSDDYNAGIGFRCQVQANGKPKGYQCEVAEQESGMLYAIASGGWVWPKGEQQRAEFFARSGEAFRSGKWNHLRIKAEGDSLQIWVNGILVTDIEDDRHRSGRIALQHHGKGGVHRYRNVLIRRLNE